SGGVDSSTIVALMRRGSPTPLHTFSIEFPCPEYNEGPYSRLAADHLHTEHHSRLVDGTLADLLPEFAWRMDLPLGDDSALATYLLSRRTREQVTVALSGDGADELFAGYVTYQADGLHRWLGPARRFARLALRGIWPFVPEKGAKLSRRFQAEQLHRGLGLSA